MTVDRGLDWKIQEKKGEKGSQEKNTSGDWSCGTEKDKHLNGSETTKITQDREVWLPMLSGMEHNVKHHNMFLMNW